MTAERRLQCKMTVSQALSERTLLRKKIEQTIEESELVLCIANKASESRIQGIDKGKFIAGMKSDYQSLTDKMARLQGIEAAIAKHNSECDVEIAGITYKKSEAIAMKQFGLVNHKNFLEKMKDQFATEKMKCDGMNRKIEEKSGTYMAENFGTKEKGTNDYEAERQKWIKNNEYEVVDPLDIKVKIDELDKYISDFELNVDTALSVSNATNEIDIFY